MPKFVESCLYIFLDNNIIVLSLFILFIKSIYLYNNNPVPDIGKKLIYQRDMTSQTEMGIIDSGTGLSVVLLTLYGSCVMDIYFILNSI